MSAQPKFLAVKKWDDFQHHHDGRRLPWIKLYDRLLEDYEFDHLPEMSQLHLVKIWMLANRIGNKIPNDPTWIRQQIRAKQKVLVPELRAKGWLITWRVPRKESVLQEEPAPKLSSVSPDSNLGSSRPEAEAEQRSSVKGSSRSEGTSGAAVFQIPGKAGAIDALVAAVREGDDKTPDVIRSFRSLPEAAFRETLEELTRCRQTIRVTDAAFVVGILKDRDGRRTA